MKRATDKRLKLSSGERIIQSLKDAIAWAEGCETQARVTQVQVPIGRSPKGQTDWGKLRTMTDEEVRAAAEADPDNPPLTDDEIARLKRVPVARTIRLKLGMTQEEFARTYHLSLSVLRDWEQQRCQPDQAARTLLRVIDRSPEALHDTRK